MKILGKIGKLAWELSKATGFEDDFKHFVESGGTFVDEKTAAKRMDICNSCPENKNGQCQACGCIINIKTKMDTHILEGLGKERVACPLQKW